jgi:hypothetical protein
MWEERLLAAAQARGVEFGMIFLDGTSIRAHRSAAGAARKGDLERSETAVRRLAVLAVALGAKPA